MKYLSCWLFLISFAAHSQSISGFVTDQNTGKAIENAEIFIENSSISTKTNADGFYKLSLKTGKYQVVAFYLGMKSIAKTVSLNAKNSQQLDFSLQILENTLQEIAITDQKEESFGIRRLRSVEGTAIYEAKKTEVIILDDLAANLATNNARQVFAKVAGLNIWESDAGGIQLGIGGRGLNPKRSTEFNTRHNGYDLSADALGYPESYYTPPTEGLDRIEVVRGAASLQYGTQFGGMVNFVLKQGTPEKALQVVSRQTMASFGFFNSFNSFGGTYKKLNYYAFYQYKKSDGWRANSNFDMHTAYANLNYQVSEKLKIRFDLTIMEYLAKQAGGLTDAQFEQNPQASFRNRNWFKVNWNVAALILDYKFSDKTKLNIRQFGLLASRKALGFLGTINRVDPLTNRDYLNDDYKNWGNETRLIHQYHFFGNISSFVAGTRYYQGNLYRQQGEANDKETPYFYYLNPTNLEGSDYYFPSRNFSFFLENIFVLSPKFSLTPGFRFEYIKTMSQGYYQDRQTDFAGNIIKSEKISDSQQNIRSLALLGLGISYKPSEDWEIYGNFSQNYRAINFNDMRVVNPNLQVDKNLQDEKGYNVDLGIRGKIKNILDFDMSLFYLAYQGRIGTVLKTDTLLYNIYRYRTNIADSRNIGIESFAELNILKLINPKSLWDLSVFANMSWVDARYVNAKETSISNKKVELVPSAMLKYGITFRRKNLQISGQYAYTGEHFTDATNAVRTANAVNGLVPAYYVADISAKYSYKFLSIETGINNLTNNLYFTRRADGYPGPGILPSDARSFYLTLQFSY